MYLSFKPQRIFDKRLGYYWRGSPGANANDIQQLKEFCPLQNVHAIQVLQEYCPQSDSTNFFSYEINLVLKDKSRVNVVDHGNMVLAQKDGKTLADFLNVVLWDSCGSPAIPVGYSCVALSKFLRENSDGSNQRK